MRRKEKNSERWRISTKAKEITEICYLTTDKEVKFMFPIYNDVNYYHEGCAHKPISEQNRKKSAKTRRKVICLDASSWKWWEPSFKIGDIISLKKRSMKSVLLF